MEITELDVQDDVALRAVYDVEARANHLDREDAPQWSWQEMSGAARRPDPGERQCFFVGRVEGRTVGFCIVYLSLHDNLDKCWIEVKVDPAEQHRGFGRLLLERAVEVATVEGRTAVVIETVLPFDRVTDHRYRRFAEAAGFTLANVEIIRDLPLPVATDQLDAWAARAALKSSDYRIETHVNVVPENLVPSLVVLHGQLGVDAPTGEVDWEEELITPERFTESRAALVAAGRTMYETVAIAPDGTVAAQSTISVPPAGRLDVSQWGTFVHREHRGHTLGLAVKVANLRAVQEAHPEMRRVRTQNAETNDWMVAINVEMGFEPIEASVELVRRS
ncbi:GNAT family N-acetyltransferase [Nocardioides sp.]|uniref:GNAT family N-acetyltransferase n=1 Tax=Nocardioides sp. TaxID=35761 RepID=UPI002B277EF5|nr:GNAT family N-acetyltransferase [Nocardioides sp.]